MKKIALLGFLLLSVITESFSQSIIYDLLNSDRDSDYKDLLNPIDISFKKCDSTWRTNVEWDDCLTTHIGLWETYMKQTYDTLLELVDTSGQRILKKSQDSWQKSYDSESDLTLYVMRLPYAGFGREDDLKRFYSILYEVRSRSLELRSCLEVIRGAKEEEEENKLKH